VRLRIGDPGRFAIVVLLLLVVGLTTSGEGSLESVLIVTIIWAVAAIGWNIAGGFGGELSLGHAFFFAIGAYGAVILQLRVGVSPWLGIPAAAFLAALAAIPIGFMTLRLRGPYFALATFAVAQAAYQVAVWNIPFLGGSDGLAYGFNTGFAAMNWGATERPFLYIAVGLLIAAWLCSWAISKRPFGFLLRAVRDDELAARTAGVYTTRVKIGGLMISAALTALAGGLLGRFDGSVTPDQFLVATVSLQLLVVCYIGGIGTLNGPLWGTAIVLGLQNYFSLDVGSANGSDLFAAGIGLLFILVILLFPGGIARLRESELVTRMRSAARWRGMGHPVVVGTTMPGDADPPGAGGASPTGEDGP
jgi:branched-chain amino acid transport system permease protein